MTRGLIVCIISCIPLAKIYSNTLLAMLNARKGSFQQDSPNLGMLPTILRSTKSHSLSGTGSFIASIGQDQGSVIQMTRKSPISTPSPSVYSVFTTSPNPTIHSHAIAKPQPIVRPTPGASYHRVNPSITSHPDKPVLSPSFMSPKPKAPPGQRTQFRSSILRMQRPTKAVGF